MGAPCAAPLVYDAAEVLILRRPRSGRLEGRGPWCSMEFAVAAFVYLLRCADGSYYVGSTRGSLDNRVAEHNAGRFGGYPPSRLHGRKIGRASCRERGCQYE